MTTREIVEEIITESLRRTTGFDVPLRFNVSLEYLGIQDPVASRYFKTLLINIATETLRRTTADIQEEQLSAISVMLQRNLNVDPRMQVDNLAGRILFILETVLRTESASADLPGDSPKQGDPN